MVQPVVTEVKKKTHSKIYLIRFSRLFVTSTRHYFFSFLSVGDDSTCSSLCCTDCLNISKCWEYIRYIIVISSIIVFVVVTLLTISLDFLHLICAST